MPDITPTVTLYTEQVTLAEHQALMHLRQLCNAPEILIALVSVASRKSIQVQPLPQLSRETVLAIDRYGMDV